MGWWRRGERGAVSAWEISREKLTHGTLYLLVALHVLV